MQLRRSETTSITTHIDCFNQLLQELKYTKPSTIMSLQSESINLQFMTSLEDGWDTFIMVKGDWIRYASTTELHARIRAMDAHTFKPKTPSNPSIAQPTQPAQDAAQALASHFDHSATSR